MNTASLQKSEWARAATVVERAAALGRNPTETTYDEHLASETAAQWRHDADLSSDEIFADRLVMDELSPEEWLRAVAADPAAAADGLAESDWFQALLDLDQSMHAESESNEDQTLANELGLLQVFAIPIRNARLQVRSGIRDITANNSALPANFRGDPAAIEAMLFLQLLPGLLLKTSRTLTLELNVARLQGQLTGETPQQRYRSFIDRLSQPAVARAILTEYPVLARQGLLFIDQWRRFSVEFVRHLCEDWPALCKTFALTDADAGLASLTGDAGDRHCDGRAVQLLTLHSGRKLVYKPRSLGVDQGFQELLTWLNQQGADPEFRTLSILDAGDRGWIEFVEHEDCQTAEQITRFYRRQGGYLALLHAVGATDIHFENLIAAGEHPMLVDLETLFHQRLPGLSKDPAGQGMSNSVIAVRLLPRVSYVEGIVNPVDFSALGATAGQEIPFPERHFAGDGTDEMHVQNGHSFIPKGTHRPTLLGADVPLAPHGPDLLRGFVDTYQLLLRHREELTAANGPIEAFAETQTRFIARVTQIYFIFLEHSFHPDRLRDGLDRDRWFDQLWKQVQQFPGLARLVHAERAALYNNDIPLFHSCPGSRDLVGSTGERIADFFERTAMEIAHDRLNGMGPDDLARQSWLIRASLAMLPDNETLEGDAALDLLPSNAEPGELIAAATRLGDELVALAYQSEDEAGWLGFHPRKRGWSIGALELDADDGLPGVALFLLELGFATGERRYTDLARKAMAGVTRRLAASGPGEITSDLRAILAELAALAPSIEDRQLQRRILQAARLALEASGANSPHQTATHSAATRPLPRGIETPGLRGGLAGRGHELLRRANAAVLRPACVAVEPWF